MKNLIGIVLSYIFVFTVMMVSTLLTHRKVISGEISRKFIHIGVSNWWIIAMLFFNNPWAAAIPPASFVLINYYSYRNQTFEAMERAGKGGLGTVYFAISLLVLSLITFGKGNHPYIGALGILIMGYGDGFAAIIGTRFKSISFRLFGGNKTLAGSIAMFFFSFLAALFILIFFNPSGALRISLILAASATILELISPAGLDNLTVPLIIPSIYLIII